MNGRQKVQRYSKIHKWKLLWQNSTCIPPPRRRAGPDCGESSLLRRLGAPRATIRSCSLSNPTSPAKLFAGHCGKWRNSYEREKAKGTEQICQKLIWHEWIIEIYNYIYELKCFCFLCGKLPLLHIWSKTISMNQFEYVVTFRRIVRIGSKPSVQVPLWEDLALSPSPPCQCCHQGKALQPCPGGKRLKTGFLPGSNPPPLDSSDTSCLESSRSSLPFFHWQPPPLSP